MHTGIVTGGDLGAPIRAFWWCSYCEIEFYEPRGTRYWAPVIASGDQSKRCDCGRKLHRIG